jgi:hypothetical protein
VYLENIVMDAVDPGLVGRFWEQALGGSTLTREPDAYETRVRVEGGPVLDVCVQQVPQPPAEPLRLHLDLAPGDDRDATVERLLALGATHLDIGQGDVPWVVMADPGGTPFCVMEERAAYAGSGPVAALPLDSSDPDRDARLWGLLSGWAPVDGVAPRSLRHPSGRGPLLELCPEGSRKGRGGGSPKNRIHLDIRLQSVDDPQEVRARILGLGGREREHDWGPLPWRVYTDGSGNELCVLPARD